MTRLINVEDATLLKTVADGGLSAKALWRRINAQPTVDAIPVEWMRQFKETPVTEESAKRCDECGGDFVEWMILEWAERKEE